MSSTYSAGYQPYFNQGTGPQTPSAAVSTSDSTTGSYSDNARGSYHHSAVVSSVGQTQGSSSYSQQSTSGYQQSSVTNSGNQTPGTSDYGHQSNIQDTYDYNHTAFNQTTTGYDSSYGLYPSNTSYDSTGANSAYENSYNDSGFQGSYGSVSTENPTGTYASGSYSNGDSYNSYNTDSSGYNNSGYNSNMSGYTNHVYNNSTGGYDNGSSQYSESGSNNNTGGYSNSSNSGFGNDENGNYDNSNSYHDSGSYDNQGGGYDGYSYYDGNLSNSGYDNNNNYGNDYGYSNYSGNGYSVGTTHNQSYSNQYHKKQDKGEQPDYTYSGYATGISRGLIKSDNRTNSRGIMRGARGSRGRDNRGMRGRGGNRFNSRGRPGGERGGRGNFGDRGRGGDNVRMNQRNLRGNTRGRGFTDQRGGMGQGGLGRGSIGRGGAGQVGDHRGNTRTQRYGPRGGGNMDRLNKLDWNKNGQNASHSSKMFNSDKVPPQSETGAVKRLASPEMDPSGQPSNKSLKTEQNTESKPGSKTNRTSSTSSVKSTDSKEETTVKKKGAGKKDDIELDPEVEAKLALLIQPKFCKLCNLAMNNGLQADQHYDGKNHAKKVRLFRQSAALEVTLKKLEKEGSIVTGKTVVLLDEDGQNDSGKKNEGQGDDQKEKVDSKKAKEDKEKLAGATEEIYCKVCDVSFNSPKQAMQHYEGKNHQKKVRMSSQARNVTESQKDHVTVDGTVFECKLCSVHVTCQEQLNAHLDGAKHKSKLKSQERGDWSNGPAGQGYRGRGRGIGFNGRPGYHSGSKRGYPFPGDETELVQPKRHRDFQNYRTPSGKFYCKVCNVTMSGDGQFAMHMDSKKHKTNNSSFRHIPDGEEEVS